MANQRISAMPSGAPAQAADAVLINRSGTNYKVTAASIGGTFTNLPSWQSVQASNFTAVSGYGYFVNTTSAAVTMTLPATPTAGDVIAVVDYAGTFATNNLNIDPNGKNFNGSSNIFKATANRAGFQIVYVDATQGWECFADKSESLIVQGAFAPAIGDALGGGYYAGQISTAGTGVADYYLIVAPVTSGSTVAQWKTSNTSSPGTGSVIDGPANSAAMNDASHPAAQFCEGLTIGGYSDWYMPAKNELEVCYYNLKPTTTANSTGSGANTNAVPSRGSNYTAGTPAQTSVTDFKDTGTEDFAATIYWSSTEFGATFGWRQDFGTGDQNGNGKTIMRGVRAVRRVAV